MTPPEARADSATPRPPGARADQPLHGDPHPYDRLHPAMYAAEFVGTALLIGVGLSLVVALWGHGAPLADLPLAPGQRRLLNGFLFGAVGAAIAYSPIGRISGAHINPAMTLAFWLANKLRWRDATCYVLAQLAGGAFGAACLLGWGAIGASNGWGASIPASGRADLARRRRRDGVHLHAGSADLHLRSPAGDAAIHAAGQPTAFRLCSSGWRGRSPAQAPTPPDRSAPS